MAGELHRFLDFEYGPTGDSELVRRLANGSDPNGRDKHGETPLHVAVRRRRLEAVRILLDHGANVDTQNAYGKTCFAHAVRRGFDEVAELLKDLGADTTLNAADEFAVAVGAGDLDGAARILAQTPGAVRTGNPEEDRVLADMAGRNRIDVVRFLIEAGADIQALGLDTGTPLHIAAWFGQPDNVRSLVAAGASLEEFDVTHESSPLGWAVHGSRYSGGAESRQDNYADIVRQLLEAGALMRYPNDPTDAYRQRLLRDASPRIAKILADWA